MKGYRKYIKKHFWFSIYDLKVVEAFLEEMAQKGFMVVKQQGQAFYFEPCEPKKIKFYVDVFHKASVFDTRPEEKTKEYIAYCEAGGWHHLFTNGKMQYFYSEDMGAMPIQTDDTIRLKLIHKCTMSSSIIPWVLFCLLTAMELVSFISSHTVVEILIKGWSIPVALSIGLVLIVPQILRYLYFYIKNRIRIAKGQELVFFTRKQVKQFHGSIVGVSILLYTILFFIMGLVDTIIGRVGLATIILLALGGYGFRKITSGQNMSRKMNKLMTMGVSMVVMCIMMILLTLGIVLDNEFAGEQETIVYYDEAEKSEVHYTIDTHKIPITFEMMNIRESITFEETRAEHYESAFGAYREYVAQGYNEKMQPVAYMSYEVIESPFKWMIQHYEKEVKAQKHYTVQEITQKEASLWQAESVYLVEDGERNGRLVIYEDWGFMFISDQIQYTEENIHNLLNYIR